MVLIGLGLAAIDGMRLAPAAGPDPRRYRRPPSFS